MVAEKLPEEELMGQTICALLILRDSGKLPSQVVVPMSSPTSSVWDCLLPNSSANTTYSQTFNLFLFLSLTN